MTFKFLTLNPFRFFRAAAVASISIELEAYYLIQAWSNAYNADSLLSGVVSKF